MKHACRVYRAHTCHGAVPEAADERASVFLSQTTGDPSYRPCRNPSYTL